MYIILNGNLINTEEGYISPISEGYLYGYGLFETLKVVDGNIFFLEEHLLRMIKGCSELNMEFDYDLKIIKEYCDELIRAIGADCGSIKILYSKNKEEYDLLIYTGDNLYTEERYIKGFEVCFAEGRRNPFEKLTYIKSNNYLGNIIEKRNSIDKGYEEAIFLNIDNKVSEGTYTNIFFVKDDCIFTPSIQCGILSGIMRNKVILLMNDLNLNLDIGEYDKEDIMDADEVFLTNSLMEIMPVSRLEDQKFNLKENHITQLLSKKYFDTHYTFVYI